MNLKKGKYIFEVYGAAGGKIHGMGSPGGYATAEIILLKEKNILLYIGAEGEKTQNSNAFNGGGSSSHREGSGGGGATDFRSGPHLPSRFLIAGGGAGEFNYAEGAFDGYGGGEIAGDETYGANQASPGTGDVLGEPGFGASSDAGAGGGLYGGSCSSSYYGCGGGSGFVYSKPRLTTIIEDIDESVIKIDNGFLLPAKNYGGGYAIITLIPENLSVKCRDATCYCPFIYNRIQYLLLGTSAIT